MPRSQKLKALVLSRRNIGEADRLITFLTREQGIMKAVAKGVRKIPSSRGGHLEPFTQVLMIARMSRGGAYIGAAETETYFPELRSNLKTLTHARAMTYAAISLLGEEEPVPELYDMMAEAWSTLPRLSSAKQDVVEGAMLLLVLKLAGMLPNWRQCQKCGLTTPTESIVLDASQGGWHCLTCHQSLRDTQFSMSPKLIALLRYLSAHPAASKQLSIATHESSQFLSSLRYFMRGMLNQVSAV